MIKKKIVKIEPKEQETPIVKKDTPKSEIEARFKSGTLSATVWSKELTSEEYGVNKVFSFTINRGYKDANNEWKNTDNFRKQDIGNVIVLINNVANFILIDESEETE